MTDRPLLKDLVDIPRSVQKSDYVISLAEGVTNADEIVGSYVVTDQIADAFDQALSLVAASVRDGKSKGAYLHGSFGSGKSHFMAVLHLLLQGNTKARSIEALAPVLAKHDPDLDGERVMLVPYHFIGAKTMEAGVLGGYVDHVQKHHPDAPLPAVFLSDSILDDAEAMRERMEDDKFFDGLGGGEALKAQGFGNLVSTWDATSFDAAVAAAPDNEDRRRLIADLVATYFRSYADIGATTGMGYVSLDDGLAAITSHAKDLGYDALLLFLDELILWLASRSTDMAFLGSEVQKLSKLVEATAPREIPIVSLIARQRALRDFVGAGATGSQRANIADNIDWQGGRFGTIPLEDTNLPAIIEQRLLKPSSNAAADQLDTAFDRFASGAGSALDTLTTGGSDRAAFRRSYPFSPALIQVLVGVSAFLQRQRTALRLLQQMLVDRRDVLTVGELVPLGDLWDLLSVDGEPLEDPAMKRQFERAEGVYRRLEPAILSRYDLADVEQVTELPDTHPARADLRLAKTLLLAALVPEVSAVRGMTAAKLANLNHGSIRAPIQGGELSTVVQRVNQWAAVVGDVRVDGDEQNPSVSVKLVGIDTGAIIESASQHDNEGRRVRLIRDLVGEAVDLSDTDSLVDDHMFSWRGRRRTVDVAFANVRDPGELPDSGYRSTADRPKVVIDYPFDPDPSKSPADDLARVQQLRDSIGHQPTLCWIPCSLTEYAKKELGRLVVLDHLLSGDRLAEHTDQLPPDQRGEARETLSGMRDQLRRQLHDALRVAYGVAAPDARWVKEDLDPTEQFQMIDPSVTIRPPTAHGLSGAFESHLDQLWSNVAPAHPTFPEDVSKRDLAGALDLVERAAAAPNRRLEVPPGERKLLTKVIKPLKLGEIGEAHMVLGRHWADHFHVKKRAEPGPLTVERLRTWTDQPEPMRLDDQVASLVVSAYAVHDDLVMNVQGARQRPTVDRLPGQTTLIAIDLPSKEEWDRARELVPAIFGTSVSPVMSAANVASAVDDVRAVADDHRAVDELPRRLRELAERYGVSGDVNRLQSADAARSLTQAIRAAKDDVEVVRTIASLDPPTTPEALGAALKQSDAVITAIGAANLDLFDTAFGVGGGLAGRAGTVQDNLLDAVAADQNVTNLVSVLQRTNTDVTAIMRDFAAGQKGDTDDDAATEVKGEPETRPRSLPRSGQRRTSGPEATSLLRELHQGGRLSSLDVSWEYEE